MPSRRVLVTITGTSSAFAAFASATTLCLSSGTSMSRTPVSRPIWWSTSSTAVFWRVSGSYGVTSGMTSSSVHGLPVLRQRPAVAAVAELGCDLSEALDLRDARLLRPEDDRVEAKLVDEVRNHVGPLGGMAANRRRSDRLPRASRRVGHCADNLR